MGNERAIYDAIKAGQIDVVRLGRRLLVPTAWIRRTLRLDCDPPARSTAPARAADISPLTVEAGGEDS